jgi:DNA-binding NarL/FixJ family response regulator
VAERVSVQLVELDWGREELEMDRPGIEVLTKREYQVVRLVAQGKSNQEIARELGISVKTVEFHVSNVLRKLGLSSRTQVAIYALRKGLVEKGQDCSRGRIVKFPFCPARRRTTTRLRKAA